MMSDHAGNGGLDYAPCRYGYSKLNFRGPRRPIEGAYMAFLGGATTFGTFVPNPFPALLEARMGMPAINLGLPKAGPDAYLCDKEILHVASSARIRVVQVMGAQNLSNDMYRVHPLRNDRFIEPSPALRKLFPEVDFTDIHFTGHLLRVLYDTSQDRFGRVVAALQAGWNESMQELLQSLGAPVILLWMADTPPPRLGEVGPSPAGHRPRFVTTAMVDRLAKHAEGMVNCVASRSAMEEGTSGLVFGRDEEAAARRCLSAMAHEEAADLLEVALRDHLGVEPLRA